MRRDLDRLANETFDLLVIGGGIAGAAIARDAALRGLSVALLERNDFAHATSAHNSKLIHGGLRYLRNFELGLVRESLRERRTWLRIAPHLVQPLPFLLPVSRSRPLARTALGAGLALYDVLALDRTQPNDPDRRLPHHTWFDAQQAAACEPCLESLPLSGAFRYFDAQMYSPERLALECVLDAARNGAAVANHLNAGSLLLRQGRVAGAQVRDALSGADFDVRARLTIVAVGPWSDEFLAMALGRSPHRLRRSKGIHLLVPPLTRRHALTIATENGHFFVMPWRNGSLLGTTDTPYEGATDALDINEAEIEDFLCLVNAHLPTARLTRGSVRQSYAGLRPLIDNHSGNTYGASRRAELIDYQRRDGVDALFSVIGGKWTTARHLAQKTVDTALQKLGLGRRASASAMHSLPGGDMGSISAFLNEARALGVVTPNVDHIARLYGSRLPRLFVILRERPDLAAALSASGDIGAQIVLAVREEMAMTLEDAVMRRTGIGQEGHPGMTVLETCAAIMAGECGWSDARRRAEIESVAAGFRGAGSQA
ncbi:MAG TPA: glycerol-3-phosphate dehydrogenase/oxidase [Rhizomicrobium sp.]|jgi:glycerol-3-phosphate dehydrogenase